MGICMSGELERRISTPEPEIGTYFYYTNRYSLYYGARFEYRGDGFIKLTLSHDDALGLVVYSDTGVRYAIMFEQLMTEAAWLYFALTDSKLMPESEWRWEGGPHER